MKKRYLHLIIVAAILMGIIFSMEKSQIPNKAPSMTLSEFNGPISESITIELLPDTKNDLNELQCIISNRSNTDYLYGASYQLELLLEHYWYTLSPTSGVLPEVSWVLDGNTVETISFPIYSNYEDLKPGAYRIIKQYINPSSGAEYAVVEFELQ